MLHLSTCDRVGDQALLKLGQQHLGRDDRVRTDVDLRDKLVDLVSVRNLRHKPEALFSLFRQFMHPISLPRLIHFFDLVLPSSHLCQHRGLIRARPYGAATTSGTCMRLRPSAGRLESGFPISLLPMMISTMYVFTGTVIHCSSSLIPMLCRPVALVISESRPVMLPTNSTFKWDFAKVWLSFSTTLLETNNFRQS